MNTFWPRFFGNPRVIAGLAWMGLVVLVAGAAPLLATHHPFEIVAQPFLIPSAGIPSAPIRWDAASGRGSSTGRGPRWSSPSWPPSPPSPSGPRWALSPATSAGSWTDGLMRLTEFFQTIPSFIFAIVLVAILTPSATSLIVAIAVVSWPPIARVVRGEVLSVKSREYVQAAVLAGQGDMAILFRQVLPNTLSPLIVTGSLLVATAILIESALSFLGLGAPNLMSWGFMVGAGRSFLRDAWWLVTVPGVAILLTVLSINLVGEGLNDALNPRLSDL